MSYTDILDAIRSARNGVTLSPEVGMLLDHYTEAVMKHITGDKDTESLCKEIYAKHRDILDLIFATKIGSEVVYLDKQVFNAS